MIKILRPDSIWGRSDTFNLVPKLSSSKEMRGKANFTIKEKVFPQKSLFSALQKKIFHNLHHCTSISAHDYVSLKAFWWLIMCLTLQSNVPYCSKVRHITLLQFMWKLNSANNNDCIKQDSNLSRSGSTFCILLLFNAAFLSMDSFGEGIHLFTLWAPSGVTGFKEASVNLIHLHQNLTFRFLMFGRDDYIPDNKNTFLEMLNIS